mgnify:FL=1
MEPSTDHQRSLDHFPASLRALSIAELEAGNMIVDRMRSSPQEPLLMSWMIAFVVALLNGVITALVTAPVADRVTKLHKVSDREGGRGMAVAFLFVPAGLIGGFLLGLLGTYLVHATEWTQFWKATGVSVLLGQGALFAIAGLSMLGLPNPPKLDGSSLRLEVEVFVPLARAPNGKLDPKGLTMSLYAGPKDNQYAEVDTVNVRSENGHIIVPGSVALNSRAVFRMFSFNAKNTLSVTLDPLALFPSPTAKDLQWTEPTPMRLSEVSGTQYTYTDVLLRFRVVKVEPGVD